MARYIYIATNMRDNDKHSTHAGMVVVVTDEMAVC